MQQFLHNSNAVRKQLLTGDALQQVRVEKRYMLLACFCCLVDRYSFVLWPVQLGAVHKLCRLSREEGGQKLQT